MSAHKVVVAIISVVIAAIVVGSLLWYALHVSVTAKPTVKTGRPVAKQAPSTLCAVTWPKVSVEYARLFVLKNLGSHYLLVRDAANRTFILVPRGCPPPRNTTGTVIYVPVSRVVYFSTTEVALLYRIAAALHKPSLLRTVVGVTWRGVWWIPYIESLLKNGTIHYVGSSWQPNIEKIVALNPQLVVMYTGIPTMVNVMYKLEKVGLKVLVDNEWLEHSYLARFEWIKLIGALYGPEALEKAIRIFDETVDTVERIYEACRETRPVTYAWFVMYWGKFYLPGTKSYVVQALDKMHGVYVFQAKNLATVGSATATREFVDARIVNADLIIISGMPPYTTSLNTYVQALPDMPKAPAIRTFRVFELHPSYWQLGYAYTDKVLLQLASLLHPEKFRGIYRTFFIPLYYSNRELKIDNVTVLWRGYYEILTDALGNKFLIIPWGLLNQTKYFNPKAFPAIGQLEQDLKTVNAVVQTPVRRVVVYRTCVQYIRDLGFGRSIVQILNNTTNLTSIVKLHPQVVILDSRYVEPQAKPTIKRLIVQYRIPIIVLNCGEKSSGFVISLLYNYPDLGYELFLK